MKRRALLQLLGVGWLADQALPDTDRPIAGTLLGASHRVGHLLRDGASFPLDEGAAERADVVVVGSGVSGASAAWRLGPLGLRTIVLELEPFPGGTSSWGEEGVVPHPWGAHYLTMPEAGARATLRLITELGLVTGSDAAGRPLVRAERLCHALEERVHYAGHWFAGLVPSEALGVSERRELDRFEALRQEHTIAVGRDGRPVFAIPSEQSSRDPDWLALDDLSMADWLDRERFASRYLRWYVEYCMLDDFGADLGEVSAWAGLHYFSARRLATEQLDGSRYLVWPEGNGHLVRALYARAAAAPRLGALALAVRPGGKGGVTVDYLDVSRRRRRRLRARGVVLAVPAIVVRRLLGAGLAAGSLARLPVRQSSPWVVCNLHVRRPIEPNRAWDSVIFDSPSLGYVDAGHQLPGLRERTVWTYYRAYGGPDPATVRARLAARSWTELAAQALADLAPAHPELGEQTSRIDVMVWGHAMPRPRPGFIARAAPLSAPVMLAPAVAWAHVDQSCFALFEEANLSGVRAAEALARAIGADPGDSWA